MQSRIATTRHGTIRKSKIKKMQSIQESQKIVIYSMQGTTATIRCGATRKRRAKKIKTIQKSCFERKYSTDKKRLIILDLIHRSQIIGPWKTFYMQSKVKIFDIDILTTSRNADRKIMQSIRINSKPPKRIRERNQFNQFRTVY